MPLILNEYDLYKKKNDARSRSISTQSAGSRSLKASESMSTSPSSNGVFANSPSHRSLQHVTSRNQFSRINSRTSQSSLIVPPKATQTGTCKPASKKETAENRNCINKVHNVVDKLRKAFKSSPTASWNICGSDKSFWKYRKGHSKNSFDAESQALTSEMKCGASLEDDVYNTGSNLDKQYTDASDEWRQAKVNSWRNSV